MYFFQYNEKWRLKVIHENYGKIRVPSTIGFDDMLLPADFVMTGFKMFAIELTGGYF